MIGKNTKNSKSYFREKLVTSLNNNSYIHKYFPLKQYDKKHIPPRSILVYWCMV